MRTSVGFASILLLLLAAAAHGMFHSCIAWLLISGITGSLFGACSSRLNIRVNFFPHCAGIRLDRQFQETINSKVSVIARYFLTSA
jgi:hypothetical protein